MVAGGGGAGGAGAGGGGGATGALGGGGDSGGGGGGGATGGGMTGIAGGGKSGLLMQDERSKIMNSSAFSCAESGVPGAAQQAGKVAWLRAGFEYTGRTSLPSPFVPGSVEVSVTCRPV